MKKFHKGFTLIELVIMLVIIGLLAAVAVPKFIEFSAEINKATVTSIAASLSAVNAVNYIARKTNMTRGNAVINCTDIATSLPNGLPKGYIITPLPVTEEMNVACALTGPHASMATFIVTGIN